MKLSSVGVGALNTSGAAEERMARSLLLAHIISMVCLPPLLAIGTLIALTSHYVADPGAAARIALTSSFFVAVAPVAYITYLVKRHKINGGVDLVLKEERLRPYLVGASSCILGLLVLIRLSAPQSVSALALCYGLNTLVMAMITLRWKISAHAAGAAMPFTALFTVFGAAALPLAAIIPVVCWARVKAEMHTVAQVCAGALLGLLMTSVEFALLVPHI
jgi:membrane-associated phospholipid phosphatase